ncbi:uncharacterized protein LOC120534589 [Polypterus senegalus]|uniref:uncharacterized protein LOC120534589 n=1 Tax=Polypterus senegalus TaxID=55291 RepID=UPI00196369BE|nr:uncharacterized protein LOC120534589 [Polypterus senegalus]
MDGLSQQQITTRVEWFVEELKKAKVIPEDIKVDCYAFTEKNFVCILDFLWKLIAHDIWFTWERFSQLRISDDKLVCSDVFKWTPEAPPATKPPVTPSHSSMDLIKNNESLSQSFQTSSVSPVVERTSNSPLTDCVSEDTSVYPSPDCCILDMANALLEMGDTGKNIIVKSLDALGNGHILCALANSFLPGTFTTDILLNDRWTANLALKTLEKLFYISSSFTSDDLQEVKYETS